jgi:hypothetical protein
MSEDTDMNANDQAEPGVQNTEAAATTAPQVNTSVHAQGGTGMTPPGHSPQGEDMQEEGYASSDISDLALDEQGHELVDYNYSQEQLEERAQKRERKRARLAALAARQASNNQGTQRVPAEKAPYLKVAPELSNEKLARVLELKRSFQDQSSIVNISSPPFWDVEGFINEMHSRNPPIYNFTKLSEDYVFARPDDLMPLLQAYDTLLSLWSHNGPHAFTRRRSQEGFLNAAFGEVLRARCVPTAEIAAEKSAGIPYQDQLFKNRILHIPIMVWKSRPLPVRLTGR